MTTNRSEILGLLAERRQEIVARFGVKRVAPFGSAARGELDTTSDVDALVEFEGPGVCGAEPQAPQPNGFMRHHHAALQHHFLDVAETQAETKV